jgi:hypothetical protein
MKDDMSLEKNTLVLSDCWQQAASDPSHAAAKG